ncbi:hypothetical protein [Candidatus Lucifugimonas marina]|uniref:Uncharacterized protein n=1 Tax=Candidatus Lucifugimonas marina TaxID=3038979 RepID=A0AAJ5ZCD6_9CHLR|nr:hypothetical protein [SAR202 cluster bacterium JH702]MDG0870848.1 hypothetical protein [SAR202 cluster bacterium JH639]WFG34737.1 hypothetical protein GKN94_03255 [SAR202 cluster bacterium JH545]WFG38664.1 hypothetical protein GKO48_03260 [SAR202 cluster bacterium JH1073]
MFAWPLGSVASSSSDQFQFVKDPNRVVYGPPERFQSTYESNTQLPDDAYFSGYSKSGIELWISDSEIGEGIYMVNENQRVEKWPRTEPKFLCY